MRKGANSIQVKFDLGNDTYNIIAKEIGEDKNGFTKYSSVDNGSTKVYNILSDGNYVMGFAVDKAVSVYNKTHKDAFGFIIDNPMC